MKAKLRILVIEDNHSDFVALETAAKARSDFDVELTHLNDGEKGLSFLSDPMNFVGPRAPNLILLDINIPKRNGIELLKFIKTQPYLSSMTVFILTSMNVDLYLDEAIDLGANWIFPKPSRLLDFDLLFERVQSLLKTSSQSEEFEKEMRELSAS